MEELSIKLYVKVLFSYNYKIDIQKNLKFSLYRMF